jgi:hypothetical protein
MCIQDELTVEESILNHVLRLLKKEMPDNVKMLAQYFQFFVNYSSMGRHEVRRSCSKISHIYQEIN